jgi:hypothetical protein
MQVIENSFSRKKQKHFNKMCFFLIEITNITPNSGSNEGSTTITITGKYLYHSDDIPANIIVAGLY